MRERVHFLLLNVGHFLDHLLMLVFATVAALALSREWGMTYAELVPYATPGFVAFGVCALPAGWLADRWSREGMMAVFFLGAGVASVAAGLARTADELAAALLLVGAFAAIYHPVGLALVYEMRPRAGMAIALNGVWGNLGVGSAALLAGMMIDGGGWRAAFQVPGLVSIAAGVIYLALLWPAIVRRRSGERAGEPGAAVADSRAGNGRSALARVAAIVLLTTAISGLVFQATTFALPKVLDERLAQVAGSATEVGWLAFVVFAVASLAQLVVGAALDRAGPRTVFIAVAAIQAAFFVAMPGLSGWPAWAVALGFTIGVFGQIPINDYIIGRLASGRRRASIYGARFVISFSVLAAALPFIAWVHAGWGFDMLFRILAAAALVVLVAASLLPRRLPEAGA
jgi:MFS family permease